MMDATLPGRIGDYSVHEWSWTNIWRLVRFTRSITTMPSRPSLLSRRLAMAIHRVWDSSGCFSADLDWRPKERRLIATTRPLGVGRLDCPARSLAAAKRIVHHWLHHPFAAAADYRGWADEDGA